MDRYLAVFFGAALGGVARYALASAVLARYQGAYPLGTMLVNVTGCLAIGIVMSGLATWAAHPLWRLFLVVGILGGYTTFSSFAFEVHQEWQSGETGVALVNALGSVLAGVVAVQLGSLLAGAGK